MPRSPRRRAAALICEAFYHGTEVASDKVDAATYGAFNRAVREAVRRINANKARVPPLLHRLSQSEGPRDRARCRPQDIRASRIVVCDPAPIPADEMQRTYDWLKSWDMLRGDRFARSISSTWACRRKRMRRRA